MSDPAAPSGFDDPAAGGPVPIVPAAASEPATSAPAADPPAEMAADDIEQLLRQAERALASVDGPAPGEPPPGFRPFKFEELSSGAASHDVATLELLRDVELDLKIELGRTHMYLEEVLKLRKGSVVALDKLAGDPVDIFVNGRLIARGEVLVLNDNFCVRVAELVAGEGTAG
ncbi:MAG TPA: flagellar motor switch protein FliN [Pirellulales bacterium]|jgi:flagellar motor switch protein FliN/FliY|nr:flagellar motor switch protein FliN [Pirellulales bacterium]